MTLVTTKTLLRWKVKLVTTRMLLRMMVNSPLLTLTRSLLRSLVSRSLVTDLVYLMVDQGGVLDNLDRDTGSTGLVEDRWTNVTKTKYM